MSNVIFLDQIPQILFDTLVTGSIFALASIGFSLTYSILKFPNIAQAAFIAFGAYVSYSISTRLGLGFAAGVLGACLLTGILGALSYFILFRPLSFRTPGFIAPTVASVGYGLALIYIFQQIWGRSLLVYSMVLTSFALGPIRTNWLFIMTIFSTLILVGTMHFLLTKTKLGAAMRATSSNEDLVKASGIRTTRIITFIWFIGSALAGLAGVFLGSQNGVTPVIGSNLLVTVIAVAIFGGIGSYYGVIAASYLLALAQNLSVPILIDLGQPAYYSIAVAYSVVILTLLYFPTGLSGSRLSKRSSIPRWMKKIV